MIGDEIKKRRSFLRLTQEEVAKASGISVTNLSMIEGNKRRPRKLVMDKIAKKLRCEYQEQLIPL